jgi:chemotaxis protein CheZ
MTDIQYLKALRDQIDQHTAVLFTAMNKPIGLLELIEIVRQVIQSVQSKLTSRDHRYYSELEDLGQTIRATREEIAAIQPGDISTDHIPRATDELDAVVCATEEATNKIMDVCDEITALAGSCAPPFNEQLVGCTTKIYEACNFQDITGQRITKVVTALKQIDAKVAALLQALGNEMEDQGKEDLASSPKPNVDMLLNGPQLPKDAASQDDIDKLLAGK